MHHRLPMLDIAVLAAYTAGTVAFGCCFLRRSRAAEAFMKAGGALPAWAVCLSIFGTYVSSISFLALPGKALSGNWNPFVFSLALPLAAWVGARFFVPFFRRCGDISAYAHLERRFGAWARTYAVACYMLTQMARMGSIMYLLALPLNHLLGWDARLTILATGLLVTLYTLLGGIEGVIYTDSIQSVVLIAGALICAVRIPMGMPEGPGQVFRIAAAHGKFSLGSFGPSLASATFWVVLLYGLFMNLQNFGIDQNYVQRYIAAGSERGAKRSVWMSALLYIPVSAFFFFIGTALFAYAAARPEAFPPELRAEIAAGAGDNVFPYYIVHILPPGVSGLLIAAIFSAAMSTVSTSVNCCATLTLCDLYRRYLRPLAGERESMAVLRAGTVLWGVAGVGFALWMIRVRSVLDAWWQLSGIFSGGMLGLFLLGWLGRRAGSRAAAGGVAAGAAVIGWMTFTPRAAWCPAALRSPLHPFLIPVAGTLTILLAGFLLSSRRT